MKRFILCALLALAATFSFGQTKCNSDDMNIDLKFKRAIVNNSTLVIDFVVTNLGKKDRYLDFNVYDFRAYDDEGNCYKENNIRVDIGNTGKDDCHFPTETPLKLRCFIDELDEYATKIVRLDLQYRDPESGWYKIMVKDIAFSRD